jgi:hypothetical protein
MSRALDKHVVAALQSGNPEVAYKSISQALQPSHGDGSLLEIEILGHSHQLEDGVYLLRDGPAVAVSKLGLVQAFFVARRILSGDIEKSHSHHDEELLAATAVILLMDPEHLTAANARKRIIRKTVEPSGALTEMHPKLASEMWLLDSLLTSRLHRHTKSPTLWSHRRWLMGLHSSLGQPVDVTGSIVKIVAVAGERHPRNYYAWSHARWLMNLEPATARDRVLGPVKEWCIRHRNDISGWSFLHFLLLSGNITPEQIAEVFDEVLSLASSLRWTNESVWVFLRTLAASSSPACYLEFQSTCNSLQQVTIDVEDGKVLQAAADWAVEYRPNIA